jgi:hypothetical protein
MFLCSDCKDRERSWSYVYSAGHCDNQRCENYFYEPVTQSLTICESLAIPCVLVIGKKNYKKFTQTKITKFLKKE